MPTHHAQLSHLRAYPTLIYIPCISAPLAKPHPRLIPTSSDIALFRKLVSNTGGRKHMILVRPLDSSSKSYFLGLSKDIAGMLEVKGSLGKHGHIQSAFEELGSFPLDRRTQEATPDSCWASLAIDSEDNCESPQLPREI
ncbi:hypothetical protein CORC01_14008 [Colletotrichum orchidophilum]|uniref:Uncharacterized protein n=1 Tax=Colletotrichum orchidophilum TaxID=1209926 RepID=A0A1G4ANK5_9PEZI|nr:uncharacterized protein CORC01_14008 [Colletotrichum orchidophilum]OHE90701.1 hypothetical protein CORC01_14008 [Colletotrichum orchidophilum]